MNEETFKLYSRFVHEVRSLQAKKFKLCFYHQESKGFSRQFHSQNATNLKNNLLRVNEDCIRVLE